MATATDDSALRETVDELARAVHKLSSKLQLTDIKPCKNIEHEVRDCVKEEGFHVHGGWSASTAGQKERAKKILDGVHQHSELQYIGLASTLFASAVYSTFASQAMLFIAGRAPDECAKHFANANDVDVPGCTALARAAQAAFLFFNQITFGGAVLIFLMTALAHCPDNGPFQDRHTSAWQFLSVMGLSYISGFTATCGCIAFICAGYAVVPPSLFPIVHVGTVCMSVTVLLACCRWRWLIAQLYTSEIQRELEYVYKDFSLENEKSLWNRVRQGVAYHCRYTMVFVNNLLWTVEWLVVIPFASVFAATGWCAYHVTQLSRTLLKMWKGEKFADRFCAGPTPSESSGKGSAAKEAVHA